MGPEAVRTSVCLLMVKEAMPLHRFAAGTIRFAIRGTVDPKARLAREVAGHSAAIGKWREPISVRTRRHPDLFLWYVRLWPHAAEDKSRMTFLALAASVVLSILMTMHHTIGVRPLVLFRGLIM